MNESIKDIDFVKKRLTLLPCISEAIDSPYIRLTENAYLNTFNNFAQYFPVFYFYVLRTTVDNIQLIEETLSYIKSNHKAEYRETINRLKSLNKQEAIGAVFELYCLSKIKFAYNDLCTFFPRTGTGKPDCKINFDQKELIIEITTMGQTNLDNTNQDNDIKQGGGVHSRDPYHDKERIESKILDKLSQFEQNNDNLLFICFSDVFPSRRPIEWALKDLLDNGDLGKVNYVIIFYFDGVKFGLDRYFLGGKQSGTKNEINNIMSLFHVFE